MIYIIETRTNTYLSNRVFLDFTKNPVASKNGELNLSLLGQESYGYLKSSKALFGTPKERLLHMNSPAVELYMKNGIDLTKEYLEVTVCAQHNNGGLTGDIWWQSNIAHFFTVGEVNGSHGIYRPGGSALNAGQVGSTRAAQFIAAPYRENPMDTQNFLDCTLQQIFHKVQMGEYYVISTGSVSNVLEIREQIQKRMTKYGGHICSLGGVEKGAKRQDRC